MAAKKSNKTSSLETLNPNAPRREASGTATIELLRAALDLIRLYGPYLVEFGLSLKPIYDFIKKRWADTAGLTQEEKSRVLTILAQDPADVGKAPGNRKVAAPKSLADIGADEGKKPKATARKRPVRPTPATAKKKIGKRGR